MILFARLSELVDRSGSLCALAVARTRGFEALSSDRRVPAIWLIHRLRGHRDAFAILINAAFVRDAEAVQRSAIEAVLCLAKLRDEPEIFLRMLRSDAASTLQGQLPIWAAVDPDLADEARTEGNQIFGATAPDGGKHKRLDWKSLADDSSLPQLYRHYRHLSANSVHVTGLSFTWDGADLFGPKALVETRKTHALAMMAVTACEGVRAFGAIMAFDDLVSDATQLLTDLSAIDFGDPDV